MSDLGYTCVKRSVDGNARWVVVDRLSKAVEGEEPSVDYEPARARVEELTAQAIADRIQEQAR